MPTDVFSPVQAPQFGALTLELAAGSSLFLLQTRVELPATAEFESAEIGVLIRLRTLPATTPDGLQAWFRSRCPTLLQETGSAPPSAPP